MSLGLIIIVLVVIFLVGGFSGRFGGYGYGYGHRGHRRPWHHPDRRRGAPADGPPLICTPRAAWTLEPSAA